MIRVLQVVNSMDIGGGIQSFLMNVYRHIDRKQVQFDFLVDVCSSKDYYDEIRKLGGLVYQVVPRRQGIRKRKKSLDLFFRAHSEYKIVHYHSASLSDVMPLQAAMRAGVPVRIMHSHNTRQGGSKIHILLHWWHRLFIHRLATNFFACSEVAASWMYDGVVFKKRKIWI